MAYDFAGRIAGHRAGSSHEPHPSPPTPRAGRRPTDQGRRNAATHEPGRPTRDAHRSNRGEALGNAIVGGRPIRPTLGRRHACNNLLRSSSDNRILPSIPPVFALSSESEQCAEQRVLMMQDQPAAKQLAWAIFPLAVALAVGHTYTYWYVRSLKQYYELAFTTRAAMMALMTAGGSLVAVWVAFGSRPLPVRLALAIPGVAIANIAMIALPNGVIGFRFGVILVVIAVLPSMAARLAGWRIIRFTTASDSAKWQVSEKPFQFSLRQMFSWMLAAAMVAGRYALLIQPEELRQGTDLKVDAAYDLAWGIVALAGVWAALGRRRPVRRSLAVVAISPIVIFLISGGRILVQTAYPS